MPIGFFYWTLTMFWLFGGGFVHYRNRNADFSVFGAGTVIPWLCVLILGLILFGAISPGAPLR